jgi:hypothetical protein
MKIDFLGKGMAIHFDKVPRLIYFNELGYGSGTAVLDGKTIKNMVSADIHSKTNDSHSHPLKYNITFYNPEQHQEESIATGKSIFDKDELSIAISITDMEPFKSALADIKQFINDERITKEIRKEYADNFSKTINK